MSEGPFTPPRTAEDLLRLVAARGLTHVKVGVFDIDGVLRGKYMHRDKLEGALADGFGFCDVVLGWDSDDQLYDNVHYTGWHTGYPDARVRLLPETCRPLPMEGDGLFLLGEFVGEAEAICPRGLLRRVLAQAAALGFGARAGLEYEFFVFEETPHSIADKGHRDLRPITPGNFGYSVLRNSVHAELYQDLLGTAQAMRFPLEGLHTETGPGVLEAALAVTDALEAADRAALFKTFTKVLCQRRGTLATFMAKWSGDYPGQSGHAHASLQDAHGEPVFHDGDAEGGISATQRHFIGGQQALMPELLSLVAPTVNSFTRLVPGFWAPTHATWGVENRTCALRVIPGSPKAQRVEYRVAGADANPYLALAAAIGSGLHGIEQGLEPSAPVAGNAYEAELPAAQALPPTLWDAAQRLKGSAPARKLFGDAFVEHFAASREWEEREFRRHVTDWELSRYFEII
jgi:glutamine synthetase